jgi:ParB family transcriptional regulator, chromosome partitioning protein
LEKSKPRTAILEGEIMTNKTQSITISKLIAHPLNPNVMGREKFNKLAANIERTGLYEPIVVRPHPKKKNAYEIINGHHRVKALKRLGKAEADCVVWDVDDEQTAILLTTLNRLTGSDEPGKKIELLKELSKRYSPSELAKLLPQTKKQIEQLANFKLSAERFTLHTEQFAIPLVFFVTRQQQEIIEKTIIEILVRAQYDKLNKSQRRAEALTEMANQFIRTCPPKEE